MAKKIFWTGMLAMALAFGMAVVGCDDGSTSESGSNGSGGTFTITNIPSQYNGKYAVSFVGDDSEILGAQSINLETGTYTFVQISSGRVNLPLWTSNSGNLVRYSGNDTVVGFVYIFDSATSEDYPSAIIGVEFESIVFSNGNATKSWNDGTELEESEQPDENG